MHHLQYTNEDMEVMATMGMDMNGPAARAFRAIAQARRTSPEESEARLLAAPSSRANSITPMGHARLSQSNSRAASSTPLGFKLSSLHAGLDQEELELEKAFKAFINESNKVRLWIIGLESAIALPLKTR